MAKKKTKRKKQIEHYAHRDKKRVNNPPVGLVTPASDPPETAKKTYQYDPHLDPQLVWAGKAEHTSFELPTVSLHVHERIDPKTIIRAVRSNGAPPADGKVRQPTATQLDNLRHVIRRHAVASCGCPLTAWSQIWSALSRPVRVSRNSQRISIWG